jgi:hypothetical protein
MLVTNKTTAVAIYGFAVLRQVESGRGRVPRFLGSSNVASIASNFLPA